MLLLDEPSSSLDPRQRERLWEFVGGLAERAARPSSSPPTTSQEAERYADRVLVLADGELLFTGTPGASSSATVGGDADAPDFEAAFVALPARARALTCAGCCSRTCRSCAARRCWSALLIVYPIADRAADRLRAVRRPEQARRSRSSTRSPPGEQRASTSAARKLDAAEYAAELFESVDAVRVHSRAGGDREGPRRRGAGGADRAARHHRRSCRHARPRRRRAADGRGLLQRARTRSSASSSSDHQRALADANDALSDDVLREAAELPRPAAQRREGQRSARSATSTSSACARSHAIIEARSRALPQDSPQRAALDAGRRASPASRSTTSTSRSRSSRSIGSPVARQSRPIVGGKTTPLDAFAVAIAVTVSLMFVTLLLAAGLLALEREEHAFARLVRGLVSRIGLLVEKIVLAALCAFVVTLLMLARLGALRRARLGALRRCGWSRWRPARSPSPRWAWRSAALAREVRAASLLAFLLSLPIAFLALVPSGAVADGLYDVIRVVSAAVPVQAGAAGARRGAQRRRSSARPAAAPASR